MRLELGQVLHFSEDPTIQRFVSHVAATAQLPQAYVWAVDAARVPGAETAPTSARRPPLSQFGRQANAPVGKKDHAAPAAVGDEPGSSAPVAVAAVLVGP